jgi:hypothetical protein
MSNSESDQYEPKTRSLHVHGMSVDTIQMIRALAAEVGLTRADIIEMAIRQYLNGEAFRTRVGQR